MLFGVCAVSCCYLVFVLFTVVLFGVCYNVAALLFTVVLFCICYHVCILSSVLQSNKTLCLYDRFCIYLVELTKTATSQW